MVARILFIAACSIAWTSHAQADDPGPPCGEIPCSIALVGTTGGVPDPNGTFTVVVRDIACNPVAGAHVVIDFSGCAPDIRVCAVQTDGLTATCASQQVTGITDGAGIATFTIVGGAANAAGAQPGYAGHNGCGGNPLTCAAVYADGVLMGYTHVSAYDENLAGGTNPADIASWLADVFSGQTFPRSDFDGSGAVNPGDLARLLKVALGGGSTSSCAQFCQ